MDEIITAVSLWLYDKVGIAMAGAFISGLLSVFLSPCYLVSIPLITGYTISQKQEVSHRQSLVFGLSFSTGIFVSMMLVGFAYLFLGKTLGQAAEWLGVPFGLLFIYAGLSLLGVRACHHHRHLPDNLHLSGYKGAFWLGLTFGVFSGGCAFGFVAPVIIMGLTPANPLLGALLLAAFAAGHCLPVILYNWFTPVIHRFSTSDKMQRFSSLGQKILGAVIVFIGVYLILHIFFEG